MQDAYLVDVAEILASLGESMTVSDDLPLDTLVVGDETFVPTGPAHFDATVTNTGTAVVAIGTVSLPVTATCARCLVQFATEISGEVDGFYVRAGHEDSVPDEQEIEYIDAENRIDLFPAVMAALMLEAPFAPLHDESCAGICPQCGADLNEGPCTCASPETAGHPFGALRELMDEAKARGE